MRYKNMKTVSISIKGQLHLTLPHQHNFMFLNIVPSYSSPFITSPLYITALYATFTFTAILLKDWIQLIWMF